MLLMIHAIIRQCETLTRWLGVREGDFTTENSEAVLSVGEPDAAKVYHHPGQITRYKLQDTFFCKVGQKANVITRRRCSYCVLYIILLLYSYHTHTILILFSSCPHYPHPILILPSLPSHYPLHTLAILGTALIARINTRLF